MLDMKWTGWLVVMIAAAIMWVGLTVLLMAISDLSLIDPNMFIVGGVIITTTLCLAIPIVRRINTKDHTKPVEEEDL